MNMFVRLGLAASLACSLFGTGQSASAATNDLFAPDLVITTVEYKIWETGTGEEMADITITNQGLGSAGEFMVKRGPEFKKYKGLAPGQSVHFHASPANLDSCDWKATVVVDSNAQVVETNEQNNAVVIEDTKCPRPDLELTLLTINPGGHEEEAQRVIITNKGGAPAGSFDVMMRSSGGSVTSMTKTIAGLAPGSTTSFDFYPFSGCNYSVIVNVDSGKTVNEYNETNNSKSASDSCAA